MDEAGGNHHVRQPLSVKQRLVKVVRIDLSTHDEALGRLCDALEIVLRDLREVGNGDLHQAPGFQYPNPFPQHRKHFTMWEVLQAMGCTDLISGFIGKPRKRINVGAVGPAERRESWR